MAWSQRPRAPPAALEDFGRFKGGAMRKLSLAATAALVLAVASVTLASASASSSATQTSDKKSTQVIHLVARTVQDATLDRGEPGDSLGDQFIFSDDLFRGGRKVGHDGGVCTLVRLVPRVSATLQPDSNAARSHTKVEGDGHEKQS
jgi:hypothetical protein